MMNLAACCFLLLVFLPVVNLKDVNGNRIIGGQEVSPYSIKYQASLQYGKYHFCGGTLVHPQWVVSAAHCWMPSSLMKVVLAEHTLVLKEGFEQIFNVCLIIRHPQYRYWMLDNDIMLLMLDRPADINAMVEPVSLPDQDSPPLDNLAECTVSGWGWTRLYSYSPSPRLRSVDVNYFSDCTSYYYFRTTKNMICAGSEAGGKDSCQGDSGGPLVCNGKFEGIVSWGLYCAYAQYPGVYTKVRNYLEWINSHINNGLHCDDYLFGF